MHCKKQTLNYAYLLFNSCSKTKSCDITLFLLSFTAVKRRVMHLGIKRLPGTDQFRHSKTRYGRVVTGPETKKWKKKTEETKGFRVIKKSEQ
jgi:hypothetical protein